MGLHNTKKTSAQRNHQHNKKTTYQMGENICKPFIRQGLISKIYTEVIQLNNKKADDVIKK